MRSLESACAAGRLKKAAAKAEIEVVNEQVIELQEACDEAMDALSQAVAGLEHAVGKVRRAGQLLREQFERVEYGERATWVELNLPRISLRTALNWRKVAEFFERNPLETPSTVRQVYKLCGVIPEEESSKSGGQESGGSITQIAQAFTSLEQKLKARDVEKLDREERLILRDRLIPFVRLYERLHEA